MFKSLIKVIINIMAEFVRTISELTLDNVIINVSKFNNIGATKKYYSYLHQNTEKKIAVICYDNQAKILMGLLHIIYNEFTFDQYLKNFKSNKNIDIFTHIDDISNYIGDCVTIINIDESYDNSIIYWDIDMIRQCFISRSTKDVIMVGLDVETSGQFLTSNGMVELGAAAILPNHDTILANFSQLIELQDDCVWEKACIDNFWNSNDTLKIKWTI